MTMVYAISGANPTLASDLPWFWRTAISCPRCSFTFLLTAEDTMSGVVAHLGAAGTLAFGWQQLVEGDPATAAIDTANLHVDPAQVVGPCLQCGYNPIDVHGPRYGLPKRTGNSDPVPNPIAGYIAAGAVGVGLWLTTEGEQFGVYLLATGLPYQQDAARALVLAAHRVDGFTVDPTYSYSLVTPGQRVVVPPYAGMDAGFIDYLTGVGLTVM